MLLLGYLAACAGFQQRFARLHVSLGGLPLFTGEAAILVLVAVQLALVLRTRRLPFKPRAADWLLLVYVLLGAAFAVQGLDRGYGLAALRDFALVYYAAFYFFARAYLAQGNRPLGPVWAMTLGATAASAFQAVRFLYKPTLVDGHGGPGTLALTAWLAVVGLLLLRETAKGPYRRAVWLAALVVDALAIYLSAYRTMLVAMVAGLTVIALGHVFWPKSACRGLLLKLGSLVGIGALAVVAHVQVSSAPSERFAISGPVSLTEGLETISLRWSFHLLRLSPTVEPKLGDDAAKPRVPRLTGGFVPSYWFRVEAWSIALARIKASPLVGIGFGPPAALFPESECDQVASPLSNCGNAHNTYLTLAMRMGVPALVFFLVINALTLIPFVARLRRGRLDAEHVIVASFLGVAFVSCLAYAWLSLFFESPYLSAVFWAVLGCMASLAATPEPAETPQ